jgi:transposase InsO family protein
MIAKHAGKIGVAKACKLLGMCRQGYYAWLKRGDATRQKRDRTLTQQIKNIFFENDRIYGARKILNILRREDVRTSRKRIRRLMHAQGLIPVTQRRRVNTTDSKHDLAVFPNLLRQNFTTDGVNRAWVSDFTYIPTDEGWLYLCSVLDLYSRRVVGWAASQTIDRYLALSALENAVANRKPQSSFIFHSDRGCQYASSDFRNAVVAYGGIQSMSARGCPYDNACAESFFKSLKVECVLRYRFHSRQQAEQSVAKYLLFYNRRRVHATLGYLSPVEFEDLILLAS